LLTRSVPDALADAAGFCPCPRRRLRRVRGPSVHRRSRNAGPLAQYLRADVHRRGTGAASAAIRSGAPRDDRADRYAAPRSAPDRIEAEVPLPPAGIASDAIEAGADGANGVPGGMPLEDFTAPGPVVVAPPPAPVKPTAYRTGGAIREPRKVHHVPAVYPEIARAARVEGVVILEATIDERGVVSGARVLRSVPLLDQAALSALRQWRYTPTLLNGVPVPVLMTVTFRFSLSDFHL
jgi:TonB family protein